MLSIRGNFVCLFGEVRSLFSETLMLNRAQSTDRNFCHFCNFFNNTTTGKINAGEIVLNLEIPQSARLDLAVPALVGLNPMVLNTKLLDLYQGWVRLRSL